jgi:hypothetical protein
VLSAYLKQAVPIDEAIPGAAIAVHTLGDFQQFNPHLHLIATDGCWSGKGTFTKGPGPEPKDLHELFRYEVLKMLKAEGKISDAVIENMLSWRHSGFNVYYGWLLWLLLEQIARHAQKSRHLIIHTDLFAHDQFAPDAN